ncbi:MAG: hypothetical protein KGJ94_00090 [Xanthomonadaceae bacterium]|nr:hypothetical protein [Xanthomonadaceae bacterium]
MIGLFWTSGHIGWSTFATLVFTGVWWLLSDLIWRLRSVQIQRLAIEMTTGWAIGIALILLGFYLASG